MMARITYDQQRTLTDSLEALRALELPPAIIADLLMMPSPQIVEAWVEQGDFDIFNPLPYQETLNKIAYVAARLHQHGGRDLMIRSLSGGETLRVYIMHDKWDLVMSLLQIITRP